MNIKNALVAIVVATALGACASPGTRVSSNSDTFKNMAKSQQQWCSQVGGCACQIDGAPVTCTLAQTCINAGSCRTAQ